MGAETLAKEVLKWWEDHQFDTTGPYGDHNAYDTEPDFVKMAKKVLEDKTPPATP